MAQYFTNTEDIMSIADAIRGRTGGSASLAFPSGFVNAINGIASDCNATAAQILNGKTAFTANGKVTGTIQSQAATTYNVSTSAQSIPSGKYLSGAQTIRGVTTSGISAGNIKEGVVVKVGDSASATRIANVTGTCIPASLPGQTFMPFMWRNGDGAIPAFAYNKESSGTTAETTAGYKVYWTSGATSGNHRFVLPCNIKFTYFANSSASKSTVTLNGGTTYRFYKYDSYGQFMQSDETNICKVWKIVSWEVA